MTAAQNTAETPLRLTAHSAGALINETSFTFEHALALHPLFSLVRIRELARVVAADPGRRTDLYFDAGDICIHDKWGRMPETALTADQAFDNIRNAKAWVILKHVEKDPEYAEVLDRCTRQVLNASPVPLRGQLEKPEMLIIVSSPGRITPLHIDGEVNFLLQVSGSKVVHVFDRNDRQVLTEHEIERFYTVDKFAADYKPGIEPRARHVELGPGQGVHIPVTAPHWVQNGTEPSISISINYEVPSQLRADVYRANFALRRLGMRPTPPGRLPALDRLKGACYRTIHGTYKALRPR